MGIDFNGKVPEKRIIGQNDKPEVGIHKLEKMNIDPAEIGKLLGKKGNAGVEIKEYFAPILESKELPVINKQAGKKLLDRVKQEPTEANLEAKAKLDELVSSTGIKYSDAEQTINDIRAKYTDDMYFSKKIVDPNQKEPDGIHNMLYTKPYEVKQFNPNKLPEPARTQYMEAVAAKEEIHNNNEALVKAAGPAASDIPDDAKGIFLSRVDGNDKLAELMKKAGLVKEKEVTEKQQAAREQLNDKVSSTGMRYEDAKNTLDEIVEKYKDDPKCQSKFESNQPKNIAIYIAPREGFDPYMLPEPARTQYFEALDCVKEIQEKNSALVKQADLPFVQEPPTNYYTGGVTFL